jgi:Fe-S-cluster-containing dehydrogenase component
MEITRRNLLQSITKSVVGTFAGGAVLSVADPAPAQAEERQTPPDKTIAMLYDAIKCIGCQSCVSACVEASDVSPDHPIDSPRQLRREQHDTNKSAIKLYRPADGGPYSFVKQQCVHCVDPACVASCMFKALKKEAGTGIVTWSPSLCVGCRYCEIVCPYHIPKFQWQGINPKIVKCEFCKGRLLQGKDPACASVCPTHAVVYGTRANLLREAASRIGKSPGRYYQGRAFGDRDGGGTQVLYLTQAPFEKLGLPSLGTESIPGRYLKWQKRIYGYLLIPSLLYAALVCVLRKNWRSHDAQLNEKERSTGLRPQL